MTTPAGTTRTFGTLALTFAGISTIIGSGWLMAAHQAAGIAGPAAILAWMIGATAVMLIGLSVAEVGVAFPVSGGMARYLQYTHGSVAGFISAWLNWLGIVASIPLEAAASVQYLSGRPALAFLSDGKGGMSDAGLVAASVLTLGYLALNWWAVGLFVKSMVAVTAFKLVVPLLTAGLLMATLFHGGNFTAATEGGSGFLPHGFPAVLTAVSAGGIIFAFNGFQTVVNLAGEVRNPARAIPLAIVGAIAACLVVYLALQVSFIACVDPAAVARGWARLEFSSPFAQLALAFNLNLLALLLYIDAVVSPSGTGITYTATCGRMLHGMQRNGTMPGFLGRLHHLYGTPRHAMAANLVLSLAFLWAFRGWGAIVEVVGVMNALSFVTGPMALAGLRRIAPEWPRPVRIPGMAAIAPLGFVVITLVVYWSRWPLTGQVVLVVLAGLAFLAVFKLRAGWPTLRQDLRGGAWLVAYLGAVAMVSWLGARDFGGLGIIPGDGLADELVLASVALLFFWWGRRSAWRTPALEAMARGEAQPAPAPGEH